MTLERRLAKIDETLTPTQLVLRWLTEAHSFGDLESYVASLLAQDPAVAVLDRLAGEAEQGARAAMRGKRSEVIDAAARSALRETLFRFELVMRINVTAHDLLDREFLIEAAVSAHIALLVAEDRKTRRADPTYAKHFASQRDLLTHRLSELRAQTKARAIVQERYLDGHAALFPAVAKAWAEQIGSTEALADMAVRLAELDGVSPSPPTDPEALSERTEELVTDLVEPAKAVALEKLGEGERAFGIAVRWLGPKMAPDPATRAATQGPVGSTS
jgi:hypothetical protein